MKIISGGQTGVDMAALDIALEQAIPYGGWVPKGRTNEAGTIPARFENLRQTDSTLPEIRTRCNVELADATLILTNGHDSPGTQLTKEHACLLNKPVKVVALREGELQHCHAEVVSWLATVDPQTLNIAGPRESEAPGIYVAAYLFLKQIFCRADNGHLDRAIGNIRHWDTVRWVVPFWFISAAGGLMIASNGLPPLLQYKLWLGLGAVGLACCFLIYKTMVYHNRERQSLITIHGLVALDQISRIKFECRQPYRTAMQIFFVLCLLISLLLICEAARGFLQNSRLL